MQEHFQNKSILQKHLKIIFLMRLNGYFLTIEYLIVLFFKENSKCYTNICSNPCIKIIKNQERDDLWQ